MSAIQQLLLAGGRRQINLSISANTQQYDIFTAAGSPADVVDVIVTMSAGARVGSVTGDAGGYAMRTGSAWAAGSTIYLNTGDGTIQGDGGNGGNGSTGAGVPGQAGQAGGDALLLNWPITIQNGSGFIYGGGGGGGGSGWVSGTYGNYSCGGGGGRSANTNSTGGGFTGSSGVGGDAGTPSAAGEGGIAKGGNGGDVGQAGANGTAESTSGGAGGAAGKAINLNGNTITWVSGNDSTHVKGAVS